jgi:chromosomal replication initiator protein
MTNEELWQVVLAEIELNISRANFITWFRSTGIISKKEGQVLVSVPNSFTKEWLENKYNDFIFKTLHKIDEGIKEVQYVIEKSAPKSSAPKKISSVIEQDFQLKLKETDRETNLNPRYTFENFIIGSFNELAHAASFAVSRDPGTVYNPLFIYGGVGLGKTHLLQAIGNEIIKNSPAKKVKYTPSEKFTSQVVAAIKNHETEQLKAGYRGIDVLIIDDVQFLSGKEKTQEEFFHTFNALYEKGCQIVLSSDRPPKAISSLEERLRSRFEGGMIADISYPDLETRLAILKMKGQERNADLSTEVFNYLAENIQKNIRELEGALNRLIAYTRLNNKTPDVEVAKTLLKNLIESPKKIITPKKIIQAVADFYDIREKELISASRKKEVVRPRQIAMYLLREEAKGSYPFIGRKFGGKDHTTAIYACAKIEKETQQNNEIVEEINLIRQRIYSL